MSTTNQPIVGAPTPRTRIVLCGLPRLLADILRATIADHPDLELAGELVGHESPWDDPRTQTADVVLHGSGNGADQETARALLYATPRSRVFQLTASGADTYVYELRPERTFLGELSPQELVDAIKSRGPAARSAQ